MCKYCGHVPEIPDGCNMTGNEIREYVEDECQWGATFDEVIDDAIDRCLEGDAFFTIENAKWAKENLDIRVVIKS